MIRSLKTTNKKDFLSVLGKNSEIYARVYNASITNLINFNTKKKMKNSNEILLLHKIVAKHPAHLFLKYNSEKNTIKINLVTETTKNIDNNKLLLNLLPTNNPNFEIVGNGYEIEINIDQDFLTINEFFKNLIEIPAQKNQTISPETQKNIIFQNLEYLTDQTNKNPAGAFLVQHLPVNYLDDDATNEKNIKKGIVSVTRCDMYPNWAEFSNTKKYFIKNSQNPSLTEEERQKNLKIANHVIETCKKADID